uniref:MFS transporter n=1 Tax=Agrobacterium rosae TaxID=1972867 RepID=A0AAW9FQ57_9HYPH|nr:hypothetical protein [Agrobacterium rosae]MDX8304923.1 hypothetical protein [Agrobacterium rosae]
MIARFPITAILALGVTQIISYSTLYYSFSVLAPDRGATLGWSQEWGLRRAFGRPADGGFTAPWLGSLIDRVGAGVMMSIGSAVAAAALIVCAYAPGRITYFAALIGIGVAANLVQYGAAFVLSVQLQPTVAQRNITYLTLIAGFASTLFWPLTSSL